MTSEVFCSGLGHSSTFVKPIVGGGGDGEADEKACTLPILNLNLFK